MWVEKGGLANPVHGGSWGWGGSVDKEMVHIWFFVFNALVTLHQGAKTKLVRTRKSK